MLYYILKIITYPFHRFFYKNIIVEGKGNIPKNGTVIFAANHQNALMDALAIILTNNKNPYFFARADIFKHKLKAKILKTLRILPIYRKQDGELEKNETVFNGAVNLLLKGKSLAIFPEAGHNDYYKLAILTKGFVRIGLQALEKSDFEKEIFIVPIGINYSKPTRFNSSLIITYAKPISLKNYTELYKHNPQRASNIIKANTAKKIIPAIVNIKNENEQATFIGLLNFYVYFLIPKLDLNPKNEKHVFMAKQKVIYLFNHIVERNPEEFKSLRLGLDNYFHELKRMGLSNKQIENHEAKHETLAKRIFLLTLGFPFMILGKLLNIIPKYILKQTLKASNDSHFFSSYKFCALMFVYAPIYAIAIAAATLLLSPYIFPWSLGIIILFPLSAYLCYQWERRFKALRNYLKLEKAQRTQKGEIYELLRLRKTLLDKIEELTSPFFE